MNLLRVAVLETLLVVLAISLDTSRAATACGGASYADLGALEPVDSTLDALERTNGDGWGAELRPEFRFLYPFWRERRAAVQPLWEFSYDGKGQVPAPSVAELDRAVAAADWPRAEREARAVVGAILDMPAAAAVEHAVLLWRGVEIIELQPLLASVAPDVARDALLGRPTKAPLPAWLAAALAARSATPGASPATLPTSSPTHPRAASLELWALERDFRARVPDGFADAVQKQVPAATWRDLESKADRWIKAHPTHPLVDRARLFKVRVRYFQGDAEGAWQVLLDLYPRRLPRVLGEMRYLLLQGREPSARQIDGLADPVLITALANDRAITPARWNSWWKRAESKPRTAWATNLEERLLLWAARHAKPGALPASFPTTARNPTTLWGKLRAAALAKSGDFDAARSEIASLASDDERARLAAQIEIARGRPDLAAQIERIGDDARSYILRVRLDESDLERLTKQPGALGMSARFELGVRLAASGRWTEASQRIARDDPALAAVWKKAAGLAAVRSRAAPLALARFLVEHDGDLFYPADPAVYRAISARHDAATATSAEAKAIETALTRSTPRWLALETYARWLRANPRQPEARTALAEADRAYNTLINWAGGDYLFWGKYAKTTAAVATLREAGKEIRRSPPPPKSRRSP